MEDFDKEISDEKLTQADLIKLMLHNAQHMATREEVKADIQDIRTQMQEVKTELKAEAKANKIELKAEAKANKIELKAEISKIDSKFDRIQWLIIATIFTVLLKDYILGLLN